MATFTTVAGKAYHNNINNEVLSLVPSDAMTVLDVGCGTGVHAQVLRQRGISVDGITLSQEEAAQARQWCRQVWIYDLERGLPTQAAKEYDCVICSHVLEHVCWPEAVLTDIRQRLSPQRGTLIVALPNFLFVRQRLSLLAGNFVYESSGPWDATHFRWYTFATGGRLLENNGFALQQASVSGYFPQGVIRSLLPALARAVDRLCCRVWPGMFGWQMLYVAQPRGDAIE